MLVSVVRGLKSGSIQPGRLHKDDGSIVVACVVDDENPGQVAVPTVHRQDLAGGKAANPPSTA